MQMNHCHLERRRKNLSICKMFNYSLEESLGTCKSHLRERPANHKPGDGIGPSPDRPENAEATQKMIEKKTFGPTKSFLGGTKTFGCSKSIFLTSFTKTFPVSSTMQCSNVLTTCLLHLQCLRSCCCHCC